MPDTHPATLTTPRANTTLTTDINAQAREVDFVSRFTQSWQALRDVMGIINPIRKAPGTRMTAYKATITLEDGAVPEGAVIPYSKAKIEPVHFEDLTIEKYSKAVTIEDVAKYGARIAVQRTDEAFLNELQGKVLNRFFTFLATGELTDDAADFQMGLALAVGNVRNKFEQLNLDAGGVVAFVNTMDAYRYLGAANLTVQNEFGITYIKNFMGADTVILTSKVAEGKIIATVANNLVLNYIDPADSEFAQLGLQYTTDGETNLIGFHVEGNYSTAVGEAYAIMGMALWAEYIDAIAVITVADSV